MVRLGMRKKVDPGLAEYTARVVMDKNAKKELAELERQLAACTSMADSAACQYELDVAKEERSQEGKKRRKKLLRSARVVGVTCHSVDRALEEVHAATGDWTHRSFEFCILDEATQIVEPRCDPPCKQCDRPCKEKAAVDPGRSQ